MKRAQVALIASAVYPVVRALGATLRWRVAGAEHLDAVRASGRQPILAFWHGRILPATVFFRDRGIVVVTSENFDGEWIARVIARFGYATARGSSSRGGSAALRHLLRTIGVGRPAGFTLDGPRGPARIAHPGALWLAKATGHPIIPFHIETSSHWTLGSWDSTQIPKPFATAALAIGMPIEMGREVGAGAIESARVDLEHRLAALEQQALQMLPERRT